MNDGPKRNLEDIVNMEIYHVNKATTPISCKKIARYYQSIQSIIYLA